MFIHERKIQSNMRKPTMLPMTMPAIAPPDSVVIPFPLSDVTVTVAAGAWRTRSSAGVGARVLVGVSRREDATRSRAPQMEAGQDSDGRWKIGAIA